MSDRWTFRIAASFTDSRPVLDLKYELEKRIRCLLQRDPECPAALIFRGSDISYTTDSKLSYELRLEAAYETQNLYTLQFDVDSPPNPAMEKTWEQNIRLSMARWTSGLAVTEDRAPSSPDHHRQAIEETAASELANQAKPEDHEGIRGIQAAILKGLREGRFFSTAHHEGGTTIKFLKPNFVFQDYGESTDREEFTSETEFLAHLRKFYDWEARRDWIPHQPPEIEAWTLIERRLRD